VGRFVNSRTLCASGETTDRTGSGREIKMDGTIKQLAWLVGAAYLVGLVATALNQATRSYPGLGTGAWLDTRYVVFGGLMLLLVFITRLTSVAIWIHQPIARARKRVAESRKGKQSRLLDPPRLWWRAWAEFSNRTFGHGLALVVLIGSMVELRIRELAFGLMWAYALVFIGWVAAKKYGGADSSQDVDGRLTAAFLHVAPDDRTRFQSALWLVIPAIAFGLAFYPHTSQALGGGRPIPVQLQVDSSRSTPRFANGKPVDAAPVELLPSSQGVFLVRSSGDSSGYVLISAADVVAVQRTSHD
jgi:hypothetical protein